MYVYVRAGASNDFIVVGSDSGRIEILQYDAAKNIFKKVHEETFGKSGCRRIVVRTTTLLHLLFCVSIDISETSISPMAMKFRS